MTVTNVTSPVVSGVVQTRQIISTSDGTWTTDEAALAYSYEWLRCDSGGANCSVIPGATSPTYQVQIADIGSTLRSRVTATGVAAGPLRDGFTDFYSTYGSSSSDHNGQIFKNRWYNTNNSLQTLFSPQTPWPSTGGAAISEVSTSNGPGFRIICNAEMLNEMAGGAYAKKVEIVEYFGNAYGDAMARGVGHTDEVAYYLRFPSSGNPSGFPVGTDRTCVYWQNSLDSVNRLILFGINMQNSARRFYLSVLRNSSAGTEAYSAGSGLNGMPAWQVQFDTDYHMRYIVKWSAGTDGYIQWWIDGTLYGNYTGITAPSSSPPNTEFGFYAQPIQYNNEVIFSDLRVTQH